MKVLFFIHSLCVGGAETVVTNEVIELSRRGTDVVLVTEWQSDTFLDRAVKEAGIPTYCLSHFQPRGFFSRAAQKLVLMSGAFRRRFCRIVAEESPDLIHYNTDTVNIGDVGFPPEKTVYTIHSDVERALQMRGPAYRERIAAFADRGMHFFALSSEMENVIAQNFATDRIFRIGNFTDLSAIRAARPNRDAMRDLLGIPRDAFVVGHVGRFNEVKNHRRIPAIFRKVLEKKPNAHLVLVGDCATPIGEELRAGIAELGLTDLVHFLGVRKDATRIMGIFDAFVLPSFSESFSLVLIEAQALGVRCVASDGVPEEVFCTDRAVRLSLEESDETWADALLGTEPTPHKNDLSEFDLPTVIEKIQKAYGEIVYGKNQTNLPPDQANAPRKDESRKTTGNEGRGRLL